MNMSNMSTHVLLALTGLMCGHVHSLLTLSGLMCGHVHSLLALTDLIFLGLFLLSYRV